MDSGKHSEFPVEPRPFLSYLDSADDNVERRRPSKLNYFNFFTEVEEEFVRRRGTHLFISPIDWALVETWKNAGFPLHVVLGGINKAFDNYDARARRFRKVNSVLYCQQAVEEGFSEWSLSQVGGVSTASETKPLAAPSGKTYRTGMSAADVLEFIGRLDAELGMATPTADGSNVSDEARPDGYLSGDFGDEGPPLTNPLFIEAVGRARARLAEIRTSVEATDQADSEALERDFDSIDRLLIETVKTVGGDEQQDALRKEAKAELRGYRNKMAKDLYDQTIENFVARRLREKYRIPRLSLFFA